MNSKRNNEKIIQILSELEPIHDETEEEKAQREKMAEEALKILKEFDILSDGGIIICETRRETSLPELGGAYVKGREYRYGKVKLTVYTKENREDDDGNLPGEL